MERKLVIPLHVEPETVDIIDKLLCLDPAQRLGCGSEGSLIDYKALRSHPFFRGINFNTLPKTSPPLSGDLILLAEKVSKEHEAKRAKMHRMSVHILKGGKDSPKAS